MHTWKQGGDTTMSISSIGSSTNIQSWQMQRPDPAKMASDLFSKLNTDGSGGISASELQSALSSATGASSSDVTSEASSMIGGLDSDGDGQVSQDELTSGFRQLAQQFDDHFHASRTSGMETPGGHGHGHHGMGAVAGTSGQGGVGGAGDSASATSSSGSPSYDPADANQDGTVRDAERLAYRQKTVDISDGDASGAAAGQNDMLKHTLMQLAHAYGSAQTATQSGSTVSVAA